EAIAFSPQSQLRFNSCEGDFSPTDQKDRQLLDCRRPAQHLIGSRQQAIPAGFSQPGLPGSCPSPFGVTGVTARTMTLREGHKGEIDVARLWPSGAVSDGATPDPKRSCAALVCCSATRIF